MRGLAESWIRAEWAYGLYTPVAEITAGETRRDAVHKGNPVAVDMSQFLLTDGAMGCEQ